MIYYRNTKEIRVEASVITLGKFDGLHIGHQALFARMRQIRSAEVPGIMFTFDQTDFRSRSILSEQERREKAQQLGVDIFIDWPFDAETIHTEPEAFIREILCEKLGAKHLVVGDDFCFGHKRAGNVETLRQFSSRYGYQVDVIEKLTWQGEEVSSTRIRKCISEGALEDVSAMLGEPLTFHGPIVHGKHLGHQLGIPTINLPVGEEKLLPPYGVYVSTAQIDGVTYSGISNLGVKPSVGASPVPGIEMYLFDTDLDLYGKEADVCLLSFLRPEHKFETLDQLKEQIRKDCESAREKLHLS